MHWVEIIGVRIASSTDAAKVERLFRDIRKNVAAGTDGLMRVVIYRDNLLESDWAVHLYRETDAPPPGRTWLGTKLADEVRRIALVDHSIWIEET